MSPEARERHEKHVADVKERSKTKKPYHEINIFDLVTHIDGKKINTVTSANKAEHDKKFMEKQSGKSDDTHPHRVHVRDHDIDIDDIKKSKFPKEHVEAGLNKYEGKYKGQSDKGYYFGFPQHKNANDFVGHVNTNQYTHAELDND